MDGGKLSQINILSGQSKSILIPTKSSAKILLELIYGQTHKEKMFNTVLWTSRHSTSWCPMEMKVLFYRYRSLEMGQFETIKRKHHLKSSKLHKLRSLRRPLHSFRQRLKWTKENKRRTISIHIWVDRPILERSQESPLKSFHVEYKPKIRMIWL